MAIQYVKRGIIQGYLAYHNGEVVGWCNANKKSDCLNCISWLRFMTSVNTTESASNIKVKSIFCFTIAPEMRRKGIATQLLKRVCLDATQESFDFVEAYPNKEFINEAEDFMGPAEVYKKSGFIVQYETDRQIVMRKQLK